MDLVDSFTDGLNLSEAIDLLKPVSIYILCIAAYAIFIFKFYRFVAARDIFELDLSKYEDVSLQWLRSALHVVMYVVKYLVLFPVFAFFWFAILTSMLAFLSRDQDVSETLSVALATVSAIRVTAYYSERLSEELAKMLPFALLAVFLIDASFFSVSESLESLKATRDHTDQIVYYLLFLIVLELVLRILIGLIKAIGGSRNDGGRRSALGRGRDDYARPAQPVTGDSSPFAPPFDNGGRSDW